MGGTGKAEGREARRSPYWGMLELHVALGCRLTYEGQTVTSAEARFNVGSLGRKA